LYLPPSQLFYLNEIAASGTNIGDLATQVGGMPGVLSLIFHHYIYTDLSQELTAQSRIWRQEKRLDGTC